MATTPHCSMHSNQWSGCRKTFSVGQRTKPTSTASVPSRGPNPAQRRALAPPPLRPSITIPCISSSLLLQVASCSILTSSRVCRMRT